MFRQFFFTGVLALFLPLLALSQWANHIVISEFATRGDSSGNLAGEFVELYNPGNPETDISGWQLQYRAASGSTYSTLAIVPQGVRMRSRSFYLFAGSSWNGTPAADAVWSGSGLADNGNLRIVDAFGQVIDRVGYGTGNNPEGLAAPNHGVTPNNNSVERKASAASTASTLAFGGSEARAGNGWDSDDNAADFIVQIHGRNPQNSTSTLEPPTADGSGSAGMTPTQVNAGVDFNVRLSFFPSKDFSISAMIIVVPEGLQWSRIADDVILDDSMQAGIGIHGDSIRFSSIEFSTDSAIIILRGLVASSSTACYEFVVLTSSSGAFEPIEESPILFVKGSPIPIAEVRMNDVNGVPLKLNELVTVNGVVSVAAEFDSPSFLQDYSGGIAIYDNDFSNSVDIGDEVTVTGRLLQFNGLTQLTNVHIDARPSSLNETEALILSIPAVLHDGLDGKELYEGMLLRINGVTVNTSMWMVSGSGTNYKINDGIYELEVRIDSDVALAGTPAPGGSFDIVGVLSQYKTALPFIGGYQLMPRMPQDIIAVGPRVVSQPIESDIRHDRVTISWNTAVPAAAGVRFGKTGEYESGTRMGSVSTAEQRVELTGLTPATIYRTQAFSVANGDTSFMQHRYVSTSSLNSSGEIIVSFNRDASLSLYPALPARDNVDLAHLLENRIDAAKHSIDICFYSLSGQTGNSIAQHLIAAHARGVRIRAIFETDNANSTAIRTIRNNLPAIVDNFDRVNAGAGLQHNKFVIIDAHDLSSDMDDWVITGSWNPTDSGTNDDAQNVVEIQDQALALAYTREFEEMWGSNTDIPNNEASRFGARKLDNTPHRFIIGPRRIPVELYFSPSDHVTAHLMQALRQAQHSLYFALFSFTRDDLARTLVDMMKSGVTVRGLMDNKQDQGTKFTYLQSNSVDVLLKKGLSGLLHHKYLLVDAEDRTPGRSLVVTGSHNWSNAAEFSNNENTLFIRDSRIALQFLQEWYKRYSDAGGAGTVVLDARDIDVRVDRLDLDSPWPNPVGRDGLVHMRFSVPKGVIYEAAMYDMLGRKLMMLDSGRSSGTGRSLLLRATTFAPGMYIIRLAAGGTSKIARLLVQG